MRKISTHIHRAKLCCYRMIQFEYIIRLIYHARKLAEPRCYHPLRIVLSSARPISARILRGCWCFFSATIALPRWLSQWKLRLMASEKFKDKPRCPTLSEETTLGGRGRLKKTTCTKLARSIKENKKWGAGEGGRIVWMRETERTARGRIMKHCTNDRYWFSHFNTTPRMNMCRTYLPLLFFLFLIFLNFLLPFIRPSAT